MLLRRGPVRPHPAAAGVAAVDAAGAAWQAAGGWLPAQHGGGRAAGDGGIGVRVVGGRMDRGGSGLEARGGYVT